MLINPLKPYLTWPQFKQLKEVEYLSLEDQVKKYKEYLNTLAFEEQQFWIWENVVKGGPSSNTENTQVLVPAIKLLAANNEYMSSPAGDYFPTDVNDFDIEINLGDFVTNDNTSYIFSQGKILASSNVRLYYSTSTSELKLYIRNTSFGGSFSVNTFIDDISNSKINIVAIGGVLGIYINDVLIGSETIPIGLTIPSFPDKDLFFSTGASGSGNDANLSYIPNISVINYIKINNHEWTFPEGSGNTTTNSQGVETTLHTDNASISENAYIKISFQVDANHTVENIDFIAANYAGFPGGKVNKFTLKYDIDGGIKTTLLDGVDISSTTSAGPYSTHTLTPSIPLTTGQTFNLYWYPYAAEQNQFAGFTGFYLADITSAASVKIYNSSQELLTWLTPNGFDPSNNYTIGSNVSNFNYSLGSELYILAAANSGLTWQGVPVYDWDAMWVEV